MAFLVEDRYGLQVKSPAEKIPNQKPENQGMV